MKLSPPLLARHVAYQASRRWGREVDEHDVRVQRQQVHDADPHYFEVDALAQVEGTLYRAVLRISRRFPDDLESAALDALNDWSAMPSPSRGSKQAFGWQRSLPALLSHHLEVELDCEIDEEALRVEVIKVVDEDPIVVELKVEVSGKRYWVCLELDAEEPEEVDFSELVRCSDQRPQANRRPAAAPLAAIRATAIAAVEKAVQAELDTDHIDHGSPQRDPAGWRYALYTTFDQGEDIRKVEAFLLLDGAGKRVLDLQLDWLG